MVQMADGKNVFSGRYEGEQLKQTPRPDKAREEGKAVLGTEAKINPTKAPER